jgi:hypothetical protein
MREIENSVHSELNGCNKADAEFWMSYCDIYKVPLDTRQQSSLNNVNKQMLRDNNPNRRRNNESDVTQQWSEALLWIREWNKRFSSSEDGVEFLNANRQHAPVCPECN